MNPDEIKSAKKEEGNLLAKGAEINEQGKLVASDEQIDSAKREMNANLMARDLGKYFSSEDLSFISGAINDKMHELLRGGMNRPYQGGETPTDEESIRIERWNEEVRESKRLAEIQNRLMTAIGELKNEEIKTGRSKTE